MKYAIDISSQGTWLNSLRFRTDHLDFAHRKLLELATERPGRQFQLICLTTNQHLGYAVEPVKLPKKARKQA